MVDFVSLKRTPGGRRPEVQTALRGTGMRHLVSNELQHALYLGSNELELHWVGSDEILSDTIQAQ
jgi:hypothetical protein